MSSGAVGWVISRPSYGPPGRALTPMHSVHYARSRRALSWKSEPSLQSQEGFACRGARVAGSLRVSHGIRPSACRLGTGRGGVGPLELELDLLLVPLPLVLYVELGAGGHIHSLPGDLDLEPLPS